MKLSRITWRCNDREKEKQKDSQPLEKGKMELNFRGVQFWIFLSSVFVSWKAQFCLFFALLNVESKVSLVLQGVLEQAFWDSGGFLLCFLLFSPLKFQKWLWNRGYWLEAQNPKGIGRRWNTKTCCSSKKKYWWPWTVLIFPNHKWCGEKREATPPTPPSQAEEASGNITNRRQQTFYCIYKYFFSFVSPLWQFFSFRCLSWALFLECSSLHLFVLRRNPFFLPRYQ